MKVILSVDALNPQLTGVGRYTDELVKGLASKPDIESLRFFRKGRWIEDPQKLVHGEATPLLSESPLVKVPGLARLYRHLFPYVLRARLRGYEDYIYHSPNFYLPPFGGRKIVTIHDLSILKYPEFHPATRVAHLKNEIPRALCRADFVITDSEFIRQEVIEEFCWPAECIKAIPLAASASFGPREEQDIAPVLAKYGLEFAQYTLCAATIEPRKNIDLLLDAFGKLPASLRRQHPLILVGHPGWRSESLHERIEGLTKAGSVRYLGYVCDEELQQIYSGARAFAYPSVYEGFGLPILEAMQSGIPVVTVACSSIPEVAGDVALMVNSGDRAGFASSLEKALTDGAWRDRARQKSIENAAKFSWERCIKDTLHVYDAVASRQLN